MRALERAAARNPRVERRAEDGDRDAIARRAERRACARVRRAMAIDDSVERDR